MSYELVSGLETHVELSTKSKIFCGCSTEFGGEPNTRCCPICMGLPGSLPKLNRQAVKFAIMAGLATNCEIRENSKMDRKNYVYPDLPKAYQISQFDKPICENGYVELSSGKKIGITRIHIEEDAGKLVHSGGNTYVDYNRGGVPLIEIVSEPDIRSPEEAREYVEKLQMIMRYIEVSDCKMQEGSMRCDVNISVRKKGASEFGTRAEIKNMNSISYIVKAMEHEFERQVDVIESGGKLVQSTLKYDENTNSTSVMREKEDAHDYRYFRDPDLVNIYTPRSEIEEIRSSLPELPDKKLNRYINELNIPEKDAQSLVKYKRIAEYFELSHAGLKNPKNAANFILGQIFRRFENESEKEEAKITSPPEHLNSLLKILEEGKIKMNLAKSTFEKMLDSGDPCEEILTEDDLTGIDDSALTSVCEKVVADNPKAVNDYLGGKEKAVKALIGNVMRELKGKADAIKTEEILISLINKQK